MTDLRKSSLPTSRSSRPDPLDASQPLIVFDGVCVLCSGFVRMVIRLDRHSRFRFATAQSPFGDALFKKHGLRTDSYETSLVLVGGVAFTQLDGFIAVMTELGWPWRAARLLLLLPRPLRDWLYRRVAENRYALFGRKDSCALPSVEVRGRFLG
ncbi:thiol-disulfide oxidoreductase DCC family protein [Mesorhizobium sp. ES1-1]|uniref:thiol-disulfide oxidoreductase DCC family protein n=1 Tax=Mesorhizobium sp. ES1-1 TaxID=2876629 RepID=UPI001CCC9C45|nr:DCC1-like thiol-disulfide oxidoreductase family protein [Mesorhizobium sp. ES1-1]MBZ9677982.1 DCC1-like thiol-disulfide oxidoreductase family protein [Mesorhizobium sp. ES1-1]